MLENDLNEKCRRCSELEKQVESLQQHIVNINVRLAEEISLRLFNCVLKF